MCFKNFLALLLLISASEVSTHPSTFWKHMVQQLNNFRRIRAVDLKVSNMQKIYWDDNLENLARQKIERLDILRVSRDRSITFWIETTEKNQMKRADEFFSQLTKKYAHREDRVTESVWNNPFNLVINGDTIRIGCIEGEIIDNSSTSIITLCVFGPSPILFYDRLYSRGPVCTSCPAQTGCKDNLCDEKVSPGLPPIVDILGVRMSKNTQIFLAIALVVAILFVISAIMIQYFS